MKRSKKLRLVRSLIASLLIALMVVSLSAPEAMAKSSKTKTMTAYNQAVVNGSYAYCSANGGLYKVNLKTETKKLMVPAAPDADSSVGRMKIYKGYLYYVDWSNQLYAKLHRIKLSGKNKKFLANIVDYAISNNKIYYIAETKYEKRIKNAEEKSKGKEKMDSITVFSESFPVTVIEGKKSKAEIRDDGILVILKDTEDEAACKKVIDATLDNACRDTVEKFCRQAYPHFKEYLPVFPEIKFRHMKSRWGSCNYKKHVLTFNYNLIHAPLDCVEYVVYHEFTHFIHPNHSKAFYFELSRYVPDYKEKKKRLGEVIIN
jgi:predicted metal-dependent hydrolase